MTDLYTKVATSKEIPEGESRVFDVQGAKVAVCNVEGKFYAIADLCSHDDGPLGEGELVGQQIECPRHGARFDVTTGFALCLPAIVSIPTYDVDLRGDQIWIGAKK